MIITINYNLPPPRVGHGLVYDPVRDVLVIFGGSNRTGPFVFLNDTWEHDGLNWQQVNVSGIAPAIRGGAAMIWDTTRGRIVLHGGANSALLTDTWIYNGSGWVQVNTTIQPTGTSFPAYAYDEGLDRLVIFGGGIAGSVEIDETWTFDGTDWTQLSPASDPPVRVFGSMTYDPDNNRIVLFGGITAGLSGPAAQTWADTWSWNGTDWTQIVTTAAPVGGLDSHWVEYSVDAEKVILFGGIEGVGSLTQDKTWILAETVSVTAWEEATTSRKPPILDGHRIVRDTLQNRLVSFGGGNVTLNETSQLWAYKDDTQWTDVGLSFDATLIEVDTGSRLKSPFSIANPTLLSPPLTATGKISQFSANVNATAPDEIRFAFQVNGELMWWDSLKWTRSDGSFARTNPIDDLTVTVLAGLDIEDLDVVRVVSLYHSDDGSTTPELLSVTVDFATSPPVVVTTPQPSGATATMIIVSSVVTETENQRATKVQAVVEGTDPLLPTSVQFVIDNDLLPEILVKAGLSRTSPLDQITEISARAIGDVFQHVLEITADD